MISKLVFSSIAVAAGFTSTDWGNSIDFKPNHVIISGVKSHDTTLLSTDAESDPLWYPVTTLPDSVINHASSFLQRKSTDNDQDPKKDPKKSTDAPDESLYGFQWALVSKSQIDEEPEHSAVKGTEYLVYRVPVGGQSSADLERDAHKLPAAGDGFEYAVVKPDTMQVLNVGAPAIPAQGSLKKTETMRMAFKTVQPSGGYSSFIQRSAEDELPLKFRDAKEYTELAKTESEKVDDPYSPTVLLQKGIKFKNAHHLTPNLERHADELEAASAFLELESEAHTMVHTGLVPYFMMTANAVLTGGEHYNNAVVSTHAAAEDTFQGALSGAASTGHPGFTYAAAANSVGSTFRKTAVQTVGNVHNTVIGTAKAFTSAWVPQAK